MKVIKVRKIYECDDCHKLHLKKSRASKCSCRFDGCDGCVHLITSTDNSNYRCAEDKKEYCEDPQYPELDEDEYIECHGSGSGMYSGDSFAGGVF